MSRMPDLICLSHLRWGFVFQRPNHLMSRAARGRRTFFFEEPIFGASSPTLELRPVEPTLTVCTPHLPAGLSLQEAAGAQSLLLAGLLRDRAVTPELLWYYTPMALSFTRSLEATLVVYDCMDELSAFSGAPAELRDLEPELLARAHLVFTGGQHLYEAKRKLHPNIHPFPSSVDAKHFAAARGILPEPEDQAGIPHPRIGFFGVIDERIDLDLIERAAEERPDWHWVMLGPVAKIDPLRLPRKDNLHWLGRKPYAALPAYLAGWDVATMPFALNRSTEFISPTKSLEYMAAGKPVVSTAIADVVDPYGRDGAVLIADAKSFPAAIRRALGKERSKLLRRSDAWVARTSWDRTWRKMEELLVRELAARKAQRSKESPCSIT